MNVRIVALPLLAAAFAAAVWWQTPAESRSPAATWRVGPVDAFAQARNYVDLPKESPVRLSFSCWEPRYVYVFSQSAEDGTLLLFPTPDVEGSPANPLPPGRTVLPGELDDRPVAWTTRSQIRATTAYVVVAADRPLPELEALLPRLRRWSNRLLPNRAMRVTKPSGDVALLGAAGEGWPAAVLARAADRQLAAIEVNGPLRPDEQLAGVWSGGFRARERRADDGK